MKLIREYQRLVHEPNRYVATIGNFDGLHQGHMSMLKKLKEVAASYELPTCVVMFEPLPQEFFSPYALPRLMKLRDKLAVFQDAGIDRILCLKFNKRLANFSANAFIDSILISALKIKALIVGDDFRFGYQRQGDVSTLEKAGIKHHFEVYQIGTIYQNYKRISSTQIRQALKSGDLSLASRLLGRYFTFSGRVIYGNQLGRTLGFPTANFAISESFPLRGVYLARIEGLNEKYYALVNIGVRPTINGNKLILEAHILNFTGSIYGQRLTLSFLYKLRDEKQFFDLETLKQQIAKDKDLAEQLLTSIVD
ncbi:MAG: bifunctional riboflavin kinase/FAD synthetase [Gammaproteobacteria bacterium]